MVWPFTRKLEEFPAAVSETGPFLPDRFAFKLFRELLRGHETSNVFFSPFSVLLCLMMVWEGATGETREAMAKVLEIADDPEACKRFVNSALGVSGPGLDLAIANSLWCDQQARILPSFLAHARENYVAEVASLPLQSPESICRINAWVAEKTGGKISSIVDKLDPLGLLVAVNAIYFRGLWKAPFEEKLTREEGFFACGNGSLKVPLMRQSGFYRYHEESAFQAVRLPYMNDRVAMYVFLPAKNSSLSAFARTVNSALWNSWMWRFHQMEGTVVLPRFKVEHSVELGSILISLGMSAAFSPDKAHFDGIAPFPPPLWIDRVIHRALVEVNEQGTEAAAVTGFFMVGEPLHPAKPRVFKMIVDRPFFFAIRDDHSNMILFMGAVNDPT